MPRCANLLAGAIGAIVTILPASVRSQDVLPATFVTPVGTSFRAEVDAAWNAIPRPIKRDLAAAGWRVQLAEFVTDAAPQLATAQPRGWPQGWSWQQADAVHLPREKQLVVAEKRRTAAGRIVAANRTAGVLRHELGHAFDIAHGGRWKSLSAAPAFGACYQRDLSAWTDAQRRTLAYYRQSGAAGRQETFAEAFASELGGGSDVTLTDEFRAAFPHTLAYVRQLLRR